MKRWAAVAKQARRLLRLTLVAPAVMDNLLANPDVAINLENVLRGVMPLDWQEQGAVFVGRDLTLRRSKLSLL